MPFTLCHPAIILPLHRSAPRATSLPALVIGSMMPDLVYFFPVGPSGAFTHSLPGLLLYCVPAGALLYLLYHALLRDTFLAWAPQPLAARMGTAASRLPRSAREVLVVLASVLAGAASHDFWDAFTHAHGFVVQHVGLLRMPVAIGGGPVRLFHLMQHLSTLVGFIVIMGYCGAWYARTHPLPLSGARMSSAQRLGAVAIVGAAGGVGALAGLGRPARSVEHTLFNLTVASLGAAALAIVLLCLVWRLGLGRVARTPRDSGGA